MAICEEMRTLLQRREALYRLLSRLYMLEADADCLQALKQLQFPSETASECGEGYALLRAWLDTNDSAAEEELAVDYARLFLSAGVADGNAALPYESLYTGSSRLVVQEAHDAVLACYAAKGLTLREDSYHVPLDHIAVELDFMAFLLREALGAEDDAALAAAFAEQKAFLHAHLLNWASPFCTDVLRYAQTDFYKGVAKFTRGFVELERQLLCEEAER